jgi:valyl-tRNA synthetase
MDTWATSSLSPQIVTGWEEDPDLFARTFPMDIRPQAHEIIRTWLFSSVVRAHLEQGELPWRLAMISGWVVDPERRKMSKSKGNVVTPMDIVDRHGADGVRYWAARGRPGVDTTFDEGQMRVGRRLAIKLLNASRFVLGLGDPGEVEPADGVVSEPVDRAMLTRLAATVQACTAALDAFDYTRALDRAEGEFWWWADNYVELVKGRAYESGDADEAVQGAQSARRALGSALSTFLRLFAPFLPFVTEEVWSWWRQGSIHRAPWPSAESPAEDGDPLVLERLADVLAAVRRTKTEAQVSMRAPVDRLVVAVAPGQMTGLGAGLSDLARASNVARIEVVEEAIPRIEVVLAP